MSPNHGWADYCDWTARLLRGSATEDTARHTRLCGSLNTAWLDLVRGSQLTGRSCSSLARAVLENGTRHSTTWWRVYMQLSDDWLSLGRRPIVFNSALCSSFFFLLHILIWWFVRMYCAHGLISSVRWWERAVLSWQSRRNIKITLIFQVNIIVLVGPAANECNRGPKYPLINRTSARV